MEKFRKLGLSEEVLKTLKRMGIETPSEIQEKAIPFALEGRDILGASKTGSGKTLAFSSAIIEKIVPNKKIKAIVLTPTRELAEQVGDAIRQFSKDNMKVTSVYGGVNIDMQTRKMRGTDVLVGTPGRIIDPAPTHTSFPILTGFLILPFRDFRGWSQEELADRLGFDPACLGAIERGDLDPALSTLDEIADCFEVSTSELLAGIKRL
jgi:DNA-binding XRE family transcriptional regulator